MNVPSKDEQIIQHIVNYCDQIETTIKTYKINQDKFNNNFVIRNALSMPIMQIGELAKKLSDEFRTNHSDIPWKAIAGMRDRFAHNYGGMDKDTIWNTAADDMPKLNSYCKELLNKSQIPLPVKEKVVKTHL